MNSLLFRLKIYQEGIVKDIEYAEEEIKKDNDFYNKNKKLGHISDRYWLGYFEAKKESATLIKNMLDEIEKHVKREASCYKT